MTKGSRRAGRAVCMYKIDSDGGLVLGVDGGGTVLENDEGTSRAIGVTLFAESNVLNLNRTLTDVP